MRRTWGKKDGREFENTVVDVGCGWFTPDVGAGGGADGKHVVGCGGGGGHFGLSYELRCLGW